jgi:hypothetical protein
MNKMNSAPAPIEPMELSSDILCSQQASEQRLSMCKNCENFFIDIDSHTKCRGSGCNISLMITYKFKHCPLEKW